MGATDHDPLAILTRPPPNETPIERAAREEREARARQISDQIDEQLKKDKAALKRQNGLVRVLLLGQSESGKSTTLKNFRMKYSRAQWKAERLSWRAVIQLNLVRSVLTILDTMQTEMNGTTSTPTSSVVQELSGDEEDEEEDNPIPCATISGVGIIVNISRRSSLSKDSNSSLRTTLSSHHQILKLRLGPLRGVEADLKKRLGAASDEEEFDSSASLGIGPLEPSSSSSGDGNQGAERRSGNAMIAARKVKRREFGVKRLHEALENGVHALSSRGSHHGHGTRDSGSFTSDDATDIIASCRDDMKALWLDEAVQKVLAKRKVRIEDGAGFFLDDIDRIATRTYEPSDDDVVRARLRTLGVQEYSIQFEQSKGPTLFAGGLGDFGKEWIIYDVGGARTMRQAWLPFFDNVNAIIFLAPISCFDERLQEDSKINRLEDSCLLWRSVCSSKLLAKATLILFLNKCDILKRKLKSGVMVKNFLPSYGERPNDAGSVIKYLKEKFKDILKAQSSVPRTCYYYATSVTDTKATANTLKTVKDSIVREHLKTADMV
ncbi:G-protein alpha subunit [Laccaria bicolor S238N-H82]|uniref:G-protein alpha subunit n=1 Tax=Laccaria bicolor (strain S238N-H82 / ATCC MYA-4686) TaxID=486041 RepID=B0DVV1_LACBS|nr:G-protein alpha subunit [Laccaria bicolor S238N-H82]EDR01363.1 G-protein alpha subunit [Laccaria bicolor S238N-H82]|eukprot:XP_001888070.1 G-protein alpha subunit [Laccaria bicolor S238N-H82]